MLNLYIKNNFVDASQVEEANKKLQQQHEAYNALLKWIGDNQERSL